MEAEILEQYGAVRKTVGILNLRSRGKVEVTGQDRTSFLHSMISNEVENIPDWSGRYGTFLTPRGRIISDFFYYRFPEGLILDIRSDLLVKTVEVLDRHIVMEEVFLKDVSAEWEHWSLQGPESGKLVEELFASSGPTTQYGVEDLQWGGGVVRLVRKEELASPGFEVMVPPQLAPSLNQTILEQGKGLGLLPIGEDALNILRLEAGIPWYGVDMDENCYPMEARLDGAISLTKGCYVGQEVVAKATHIGGVGRLLMGLQIESDHVPAKDTPVLEDGGAQIGVVTSAAFSPRLGCPIAFAYLKRAFARPGAAYSLYIGDEKPVVARVLDSFSEEARS